MKMSKTTILLVLALAMVPLTLMAAGTKWKAPAEAKGYKSIMKPTKANIAVGKKVFVENCSICHGVKGKGDGASARSLGLKPANFRDKKRMRAQTDGELAWKIMTGKGPMPPWASKLSEGQIWNVINYIRTFAK